MISAFTTYAARLALGVSVLLVGGHAMAAGSLAIDTLQGDQYGFSFNHPNTEQADQRSMRECGAGCSIVLRFGGQCAAYAADQAKGSNAYGWATGANGGATQARAMSECRAKGGSSCKVRAWGCDAIAASESVPASRNDNAAAGGFQMRGDWLVDYVSASGYTATGSLRVSDSLGQGNFRGVLVLAFTNNQGESKRVQQDVTMSVRGDTVTLSGSNPVYLQGTGNYSADNYTMTIGSQNLLRGTNTDAKGTGGRVVISRK